jgi:hypothetical protein
MSLDNEDLGCDKASLWPTLDERMGGRDLSTPNSIPQAHDAAYVRSHCRMSQSLRMHVTAICARKYNPCPPSLQSATPHRRSPGQNT